MLASRLSSIGKKVIAAVLAAGLGLALSFPAVAQTKAWTVLIFMNGKNNLEWDAINDFKELSAIGSNENVNFVVQLGRPIRRPGSQASMRDVNGGWTGAKRFYVTKGQEPDAATAVADLGDGNKVDMGSPKVLQDFLVWGKAQYPARRYAVVIWNHGQGYRLAFDAKTGDTEVVETPSANHRAVSTDADKGSIIYNADLRTSLDAAFGPELKLVGFDACLMGMVETAYELKSVVPVMVGSEELEPGAGWNYTTLAEAITQAPSSDEVKFAQILVQSYKDNYRDTDSTTLSAIRLDGVQALAGEISKLSDLLLADKATLFPLVTTARLSRQSYNFPDNPVSIDLIGFLNALEAAILAKAPSSPALAQARTTRDLAKGVIFANYASSRRGEPFGSNGLAIYFPKDKLAFTKDPWNGGYKRSNQFKKIAFVGSERWSLFLASYLGIPG